MSFLDTNKKGKLLLRPSKNFISEAERLPTSRYRPRSNILGLQPVIEVWQALRPYIESTEIVVSKDAKKVLEKLKKEYVNHRIQVRSAESRFKKKFKKGIPVPLKTTPFEHQVRAFSFSVSVDCPALLMEQGTGKTLTAIAVMGYRYLKDQVKRVLVICPKSVIPVWPNELKKHANFSYTWDRCPKNPSTKIRKDFGKGVQVLIINYDKLKGREKEIKKWKPDMVILDESHRVKNRDSQRSRVCHRIGEKVKYRVILTGTPLGQSLVDIWSQYRFLNSNIFGRDYKNFEKQFCVMGGYMGYEIKKYKNLKTLSKKIHSIAFRCLKKECLDLPPQIIQNLYCEADAETKRIYREMERDLFTIIGKDELEVEVQIAKITKLRQIVGGLVKAEDKLLPVSKKKLSTLQQIIEDKNWASKLAIFVNFKHEITLIADLCKSLAKEYLVLSGDTSENDRFNIEKTFKKNKNKSIIIIQVDTGAEGLDFTAADMGVFFSPTFSIQKYEQVKARLHRQGQIRPVTYINILMEGTIDEQIMEFISKHGNLTSKILDRNKGYTL